MSDVITTAQQQEQLDLELLKLLHKYHQNGLSYDDIYGILAPACQIILMQAKVEDCLYFSKRPQ